jgi:peptidoglycan/xylan/chitin deacetylase (PgdA/CDA1 family)
MIDGGEAIRKLALNVARFTGLAPLARPLVGGVGAILMLHRVTANPEKPLGVNRHLNIAPDFLDAVLSDMKARDYQFVTLDEAVERLRKGDSSGQFATITADDAYRDNLTEALPVLENQGAPLTIYVAPALISGRADLWWDVVDEIVGKGGTISLETSRGREMIDCSTPAKKFAANTRLHEYLTAEVREEDQRAVLRSLAQASGVDPDEPRRKTLMNWDEIRRVAAHPLVTIGAHTVHHYNLMRLDEETARREMTEAARLLESEIGQQPRHMAYPYGYAGAVGAREVALAREAGYASAVTTRHGVLRAEHAGHLHALPRISVNGRYQRVAHIRTMLSGVTTPLANAGKMVVTV